MNKLSYNNYLGPLITFFLTFIVIIIGLFRLNWSLPPISGLDSTMNDQAGYISGARYLLDKGEIDNCTIYPSILLQKTSQKVFYGPGHYWALLIPISIFGANEISFMLSNLICLILCIPLIYYYSKKYYSSRAAVVAPLLFLCFPFMILYGLSAMSELTGIFFTFFSFILVELTKDTRFKFFSPFFIIVPVIFRETSIVVLFPIAAILFNDQLKTKNYKGIIIFLFIGVFCWILILFGPLGGRPTLLKANIFGSTSEKYLDAFSFNNFNPSIDLWIKTIFNRYLVNMKFIILNDNISMENFTLKLLFIIIIITTISGFIKNNYFDIGVSIMSFILFSFICGLYTPGSMRGIRILMVCVPFFCVSLSKWASFLSVLRLKLFIIFLFIFWLIGFIIITNNFNYHKKNDDIKVKLINNLSISSNEVLIAPYEIGIPWVFKNYPSKWSFLPANIQTMNLLNKEFNIRTIILSENEINEKTLDIIEPFGFIQVNSFYHGHEKFMVFRKLKRTIPS